MEPRRLELGIGDKRVGGEESDESSHGVAQGDEESISWITKKVRVGLEGEERGWRGKSHKVTRLEGQVLLSSVSKSSRSSISTLVCSPCWRNLSEKTSLWLLLLLLLLWKDGDGNLQSRKRMARSRGREKSKTTLMG